MAQVVHSHRAVLGTAEEGVSDVSPVHSGAVATHSGGVIPVS